MGYRTRRSRSALSRFKRPVLWAFTGVLTLYVGLAAFHLANGFNFTDALRGPLTDARVTVDCLGDWGTVGQFINREAFFGVDMGRFFASEICP